MYMFAWTDWSFVEINVRLYLIDHIVFSDGKHIVISCVAAGAV